MGKPKPFQMALTFQDGTTFNVPQSLTNHPHYEQVEALVKVATPIPANRIFHKATNANNKADAKHPYIFQSSEDIKGLHDWCQLSRSGRVGSCGTFGMGCGFMIIENIKEEAKKRKGGTTVIEKRLIEFLQSICGPTEVNNFQRVFFCSSHHDPEGKINSEASTSEECQFDDPPEDVSLFVDMELDLLEPLNELFLQNKFHGFVNDLSSTLVMAKEHAGRDPPPVKTLDKMELNLLEFGIPSPQDKAFQGDEEIIHFVEHHAGEAIEPLHWLLSSAASPLTGLHHDDGSPETVINFFEGSKLLLFTTPARLYDDQKRPIKKKEHYSEFMKLMENDLLIHEWKGLKWHYVFAKAGSTIVLPPNAPHLVLGLGEVTTLQGYHFILPSDAAKFVIGSTYEQRIQETISNINNTVPIWISTFRALITAFESIEPTRKDGKLDVSQLGTKPQFTFKQLLFLSHLATNIDWTFEKLEETGNLDSNREKWERILQLYREYWNAEAGDELQKVLHDQ
jgi:hypothetical protein